MIDALLSVKPTPTIGAPPEVTPGEPKAPLLPPVVCTPPMLFVVLVPPAPVVVVPPIPVDEPNPPPELESVLPMVDVGEPLLPKADPEFPPKGAVDDPEANDEPLLPNPDPEEPRDELLPPSEDPEEPKGDEDPNEPMAAVPVPVPIPVVAPVGVMPFCCTAWPNNPVVGTFCSPL